MMAGIFCCVVHVCERVGIFREKRWKEIDISNVPEAISEKSVGKINKIRYSR